MLAHSSARLEMHTSDVNFFRLHEPRHHKVTAVAIDVPASFRSEVEGSQSCASAACDLSSDPASIPAVVLAAWLCCTLLGLSL